MIPLRVDPDLIDNHESPRAAKQDRARAEEILRAQEADHDG